MTVYRHASACRGQGDEGASMIVVMIVGLVLTLTSVAMLRGSMFELNASANSTVRATSFEAAEAGIDDYLAKLTEDHQYYAHHVHPAESTRRRTNGATVAAGSVWPGELVWTYPNGSDGWRALGNGYEYNLRVTAPATGSLAVKIVSTGRKVGATRNERAVEVLVRSASIADFQMISNADISYGSAATTRGKIYAGVDSGGVKHSIAHSGTAYADLFAEGSITQAPTYRDGAKGYTSSNIRTMIRNPVNFNAFTSSLVDIKNAALDSGIYLDDSRVDGWRLTFNSNGTVTIATCKRQGSNHLAQSSPTCTTSSTRNVPVNGSIFVNQSVIALGTVKGQVTVASNVDVVIGGNITYVTAGTDVLGLIAKNEMLIPTWAPNNLTWTAATIAQTGQWRSWSTSQSLGTMTFTGSTATNQGGYMTMFSTRNYNYDPNLLYVQPPNFPVLEEAYSILLFRELNT